MNRDELLNSELLLVVSEPWELATSEDAPARAAVTATDDDVDRGGLALAVGDPFDYGGASYGLFIALARKQGSLRDELLQHGKAEANLYGVPGELRSTDPFALEWWA